MERQDKYLGRRVKRGLYKTKDGYLINADVNGSLNITRKAFSNFICKNKNEIQGFAVSPKLITL